MQLFLAYICLKVFETGSLCCFISSFYSIFLFKSLLKSITLRKKKVALFGGGAHFRKNKVVAEMILAWVVIQSWPKNGVKIKLSLNGLTKGLKNIHPLPYHVRKGRQYQGHHPVQECEESNRRKTRGKRQRQNQTGRGNGRSSGHYEGRRC